MAIYHLSTKPVSRSIGRSAVASIAYRAGIEITDERTGKTHDYTKRSGVVETSLHMPQDFTGRKMQGVERAELWNMAEQKETRKNSRTAREIVVNLPHELTEKERSELVNDFASEIADKYGIAVDVAIHTPDREGDNRNHHAHLLMTTRKLEQLDNGKYALTDKSQLEMSNTQLKELNLPTAQQELKDLRKTWAERANHALERAGHEERIDHRSHKDRGLDIKPTLKMGWKATQLERMGIRTEVGDINRQIKADNAEIMGLKTEIIVKRRELERQTAIKAPNRSIEPRKENKASETAQTKRNATAGKYEPPRGGNTSTS